MTTLTPLFACAVAIAIWLGFGVRVSVAQFADLVNRVPPNANAIVILNVDKIEDSPMGVAKGWREKSDKAFEDGMISVPPKASRFVLAAEIDFEFMKPNWQVAIADLKVPRTLDEIAKAYGGTLDTVGDVAALVLPSDAYLVQLSPTKLGAMAPANRQAVARWIEESSGKTKLAMSEYLQKAAGYSDEAGTEFIMAIDLANAFPTQRIFEYLKTKEFLDEAKVDRKALTKLLAGVRGIRIAVRIGEKPLARFAVDFLEPVDLSPQVAKQLLLEILADGGAKLMDLAQFEPIVKDKEIALQGYLSDSGLRRLFSVIDSPAPAAEAEAPAKPRVAKPSPGELEATKGERSLKYFKMIVGMADDLKQDFRDLKTLNQSALFCDKYARKIERLPMLGVDPELLDYGAFVAQSLRELGSATRVTGVKAKQATMQVALSPDYYNYGSYGYGRTNAWGGGSAYYGNYAVYNPRMDMKYEEAQRRVIRQERKATTAISHQEIKQQLVAATAGVRRKMTERYQVEF